MNRVQLCQGKSHFEEAVWRFTEKSDFLGGRFMKNQYIGENCLKRGAWAVCIFKGDLAKERRCF